MHCVFAHLKKEDNRVSKEKLYEEVRHRKVCEGAVGVTDGFKAGITTGISSEPFLFPVMMDSLKDKVWKEFSWNIFLADDFVV